MKGKNRIVMVLSVLALLCSASFVALDSDADISISDLTLNGQGRTSELPGAPGLEISAEYHIDGSAHILVLDITEMQYPLPVKIMVRSYDPSSSPLVFTDVYETDGRIPLSNQAIVILDSALSKTSDTLRYEIFVYEYEGINVLAQATLLVQQYRVSFDGNGGMGSYPDQILDYDEIPSEPATGTFCRDYHVFGYYSKTPDGAQETFSAFNRDTVLFAVYSPGTYSIIFDGNLPAPDPSQSMSPLAMVYGVEASLPANAFIADGYTFVGWIVGSSSGDATYSDGAVVLDIYAEAGSNPIATGDVTLFAKWQENSFYLVYDGNRPSDSTSDVRGVSSETVVLTPSGSFTTAEDPSLIGWSFQGWNTKSDGGGEDYAAGVTVSGLTRDSGSEVVLYATWAKNSYTIVYDLNIPSGAIPPDPMPTIPPTEAYYDSSVVLSSFNESIDGLTFKSWNTSASGTGSGYPAGENGKINLTAVTGGMVTLYAQYSSDAFLIKVVKANDSDPLTFAYPFAVYQDAGAKAIVLVTSTDNNVYFTATVDGATFDNGASIASSYDGILVLKNFVGPVTVTVKQLADPLSSGMAGRFAITNISNGDTGNEVRLYLDSQSTGVLPNGRVTLKGTYFNTINGSSFSTYAYGNLSDSNLADADWKMTIKMAGSSSEEARSAQSYLDISSGTKSYDAVMKPKVSVYSARGFFTPDGEDSPTDSTAWTIWTTD